ncbi:hypothetical protein H4R33_001745 [Dimargaris cristalligena]|nr:hypothetical protein H4R33_001745 [Dimargaris cristalligena]
MEDPHICIPQVDVIISEPIGVLLVHERKLESFVLARDRYLKPGGVILPSHGTIHLAPFTDNALWTETMTKSPLFGTALGEYFRMPVVGYFDPRSLLASPTPHGYTVDFATVTVDELKDFTVPFAWTCRYTGIVHGVAGWFDLHFQPFAATHPRASRSTTSRWQQVRCVLKEPLAVNIQQALVGSMHCRVNDKRSYAIAITFSLCPPGTDTQDPLPAGCITREGRWYLHEQTYNSSYNPSTTEMAVAAAASAATGILDNDLAASANTMAGGLGKDLIPSEDFYPESINLYAPNMTIVANAKSLIPPTANTIDL